MSPSPPHLCVCQVQKWIVVELGTEGAWPPRYCFLSRFSRFLSSLRAACRTVPSRTALLDSLFWILTVPPSRPCLIVSPSPGLGNKEAGFPLFLPSSFPSSSSSSLGLVPIPSLTPTPSPLFLVDLQPASLNHNHSSTRPKHLLAYPTPIRWEKPKAKVRMVQLTPTPPRTRRLLPAPPAARMTSRL